GCRRTPPVVLWLQTVNRYDKMKVGQTGPGRGNGANRTSDELYLNPDLGYAGKQDIQLAITYQGFPSHDGEVQGAEASNQGQHAIHQILAGQIAQLAQRHATAQMFRFISITAGASEWTFLGNFNRQKRLAPPKNTSPGGKNIGFSHLVFLPR